MSDDKVKENIYKSIKELNTHGIEFGELNANQKILKDNAWAAAAEGDRQAKELQKENKILRMSVDILANQQGRERYNLETAPLLDMVFVQTENEQSPANWEEANNKIVTQLLDKKIKYQNKSHNPKSNFMQVRMAKAEAKAEAMKPSSPERGMEMSKNGGRKTKKQTRRIRKNKSFSKKRKSKRSKRSKKFRSKKH